MVNILLIQPLPATQFDNPENVRLAETLLAQCRARGPTSSASRSIFPFMGGRNWPGRPGTSEATWWPAWWRKTGARTTIPPPCSTAGAIWSAASPKSP